ncbi:DUF72 domain-containing protein [Candidatus Bathyarchaeota archaeon]|nr:DUF72 domain-containing protein [Candidatus Bathyarchaeota archaeon]
MKFYVGTSGWSYFWNKGGNFDWFVTNSGLNAVELNASFYRFPFPNMIKSWAVKGRDLRWSIKVNRLITHRFRFKDKALQIWGRFHKLFSPMDEIVDFYLFQLPPSTTPKYAPRIERFAREIGLGERFALEFRNMEWFDGKWVDWASGLGITLVSVDSPDFPLKIFNTNGMVYVRMHGRTAWYSHIYTERELKEVLRNALGAHPIKLYVFFNNDHGMLINAQRTMELLQKFRGHFRIHNVCSSNGDGK